MAANMGWPILHSPSCPVFRSGRVLEEKRVLRASVLHDVHLNGASVQFEEFSKYVSAARRPTKDES
jgi:hypothetical protein